MAIRRLRTPTLHCLRFFIWQTDLTPCDSGDSRPGNDLRGINDTYTDANYTD